MLNLLKKEEMCVSVRMSYGLFFSQCDHALFSGSKYGIVTRSCVWQN